MGSNTKRERKELASRRRRVGHDAEDGEACQYASHSVGTDDGEVERADHGAVNEVEHRSWRKVKSNHQDLGSTYEEIGSDYYVPLIGGRFK